MILYALRNKKTGEYLPGVNRRRGFTYDEPTNYGSPRLFEASYNAKKALDAWLRGHATVDRSYDDESNVYYVKVDGRVKDDWEIVEVRLEWGDVISMDVAKVWKK